MIFRNKNASEAPWVSVEIASATWGASGALQLKGVSLSGDAQGVYNILGLLLEDGGPEVTVSTGVLDYDEVLLGEVVDDGMGPKVQR